MSTAAREVGRDATSSTLYFGPWYRKSPFFERTLAAGCSAYDIYNHMYLPAYYGDPIEEYWALLNGVTLWDVGVERIVEISGPDASRLTNMLTCRDLTKCAPGQGKYVLITAEDGGIINDPVLLRIEPDRWWLALADSDAGLWARGVAVASGMDVTVREPEVYPVQVQGPKSKHVIRGLFGDEVADLRYYWTAQTAVDGIPVVVSRTGWTGEVGYEVYLQDPARGEDLWDRIMEAGAPYDIRPIAPCEARRIEAGIFNYGSDMTIANNPFEISGLERLVEEQDADYIGKAALEAIRRAGVRRKLVGIEVPGTALPFEIAEKRPAVHRGRQVGVVTDLIWSPRLATNIGYVWVPIELAAPGTELEVEGRDGSRVAGRTAALPFIDPKKQIPRT
jgi:aminomethyltransferase